MKYMYDLNNICFTVPPPPTPPPPPPPPPGCFPASAKVRLVTGKAIEMSELHTGEQVQIGRSKLFH